MDAMMLMTVSAEHARRSMSLTSVIAEYEDKIEELSEAELVLVIEQVKMKTSMLQQENSMLESYLVRTNKKLLDGIQWQFDQKRKASLLVGRRLLAAASSMLSSSGQLSHRSSDTLSSPMPSCVRSGSIFRIASVLDQAPRLSVSQKFEVVSQELDEVFAATRRLRAQHVKQQSGLVAEMENAKLMQQEVSESLARFRTSLADPRVPAEKFVRLLEDCLKSTDFKTQKMQLHNNALRQQYCLSRKVLDSELANCIGPANFEELDIENNLCKARLAEQNTMLSKFRELEGQCIIQDNNSHRALKQQQTVLECVEKRLHNKQEKLDKLSEQVRQAEEELASAEQSYVVMKTIHKTYQIPDTMDYLKKKAEIEDLQRQLKTWHRKNKVQHAALKMSTLEFQKLMQTAQSQGKFGESAGIAGMCSFPLENSNAPRKFQVSLHNAVKMASCISTSNRNKDRGIAVA